MLVQPGTGSMAFNKELGHEIPISLLPIQVQNFLADNSHPAAFPPKTVLRHGALVWYGRRGKVSAWPKAEETHIYYVYIYIYMWQGPFGIMRTIACFKHPTPASVLVPFLSPCLPPCSLQLVPLLLFLPLSCCPSLCMYILDAQVSLFSICLRACLPLFSSGSVLSFLPNH